MFKLLRLEFYKTRHTKTFFVFGLLFLLFLLAVPLTLNFFFTKYLDSSSLDSGLKEVLRQFSIFDFRVIWHYLTWIYKYATISLSFIVIVSVTSEFRERTIRQNIIDGLSKTEFLISKLFLVLGMATIVTLAVFVIGIVMGTRWSQSQGVGAVFGHIHYLGRYFVFLLAYLLFSFCLALLVRRSGLTIGLLFFYGLLIEPITCVILDHGLDMEWLAQLLPMEAMSNLIRSPVTRMIMKSGYEEVTSKALVVTLVWIGIYLAFANWMLRKRDL